MSSRTLVMVVAMVLAIGACSSGDDGATGRSESGVESGPANRSTVPSSAESIPPTARGRTDVGLVTNLPTLDVAWSEPALAVPDQMPAELSLAHVGIVDGDIVVVAFGWQPPPENQIVYTWRSADGTVWSRSMMDIAQGQVMHEVVATRDGMIGLGSRSASQTFLPLVHLWEGDDGWVELDLTSSGLDLDGVEIVGAAITEAGYVLGARRYSYEADVNSVVFEADGYRFEINDVAGTYAVTEADGGRLVSSGPLGDVYRYQEEGQAVYDLETRELLTVVPWEVWEEQYVSASPLPIPVPTDGGEPGRAAIQWDGYEITAEEERDHYTVVELATGTVIASGSLADLYRGPPPLFFDRVSGDPLVGFEWDQWYGLLEAAYETAYEPHVAHGPDHILLFSPDGRQWSEQPLGAGDNTHVESVFSLDDRFVVTVAEHLDFGTTRHVHRSTDGLAWEETDGVGPEYLNGVTSGQGQAIALSDLAGSSAVATSADGANWSTAFFIPQQDDGRHGWLQLVASGGLGQFAVATLNPSPAEDVLSITVGSRTARFGAVETAVRITDDTTGELLLDLGWQELEEGSEGIGSSSVTYTDGTTSFWNADGGLVMKITDDEAFAAFAAQAERYQAGIDHLLFVGLGGDWYEAELPVMNGAVPDRLAVGADMVLVGTIRYGGGEAGAGSTNEIGLLLGRLGAVPAE